MVISKSSPIGGYTEYFLKSWDPAKKYEQLWGDVVVVDQEQEWTWNVSESQKQAATRLLEAFRNRVFRLFFAFGGLGEARELLKTQFEQTFDPIYSEVPFASAYQVNDDPNNIELSTIAVMKQGELIDALQRGGEFEIQNCHALIVFMYHLWDEYYRPKMAETLGLEESGQLKSDLFGDLRLIRNAIIHNQADLTESEYNNLMVLSELAEVSPGKLRLTQESLQVIVTGLKSLQLHASPPFHQAN